MKGMKYVYGPVPSRRFGISLGISPIPKKTCNYSCIYCQLGRTNRMTNTRQMFCAVKEIMDEFDEILKKNIKFDMEFFKLMDLKLPRLYVRWVTLKKKTLVLKRKVKLIL